MLRAYEAQDAVRCSPKELDTRVDMALVLRFAGRNPAHVSGRQLPKGRSAGHNCAKTGYSTSEHTLLILYLIR